MLLLDEPASALDPIATASIEELMHTLKHRYTIVIVTHNMQQAARVADRTAFFSLDGHERVGTLIEYGDTADDLPRPRGHPDARLRHRPVRLRLALRAAAIASLGHLLAAAADRTASSTPRRPSGARRTRHTGRRSSLLEPQDPLDLAELGVGVLQHGGALHEHVDPDPVADRHLVHEPAEVPLELGHAGAAAGRAGGARSTTEASSTRRWRRTAPGLPGAALRRRRKRTRLVSDGMARVLMARRSCR